MTTTPSNAEKVTIVVVPRERYGLARKSLEDLLANTPDDIPVVYVSSAAPKSLTDWVDGLERQNRLKHIHVPHQIAPNEARNLGARFAPTPYLVFADNDVFFAPGWLEKLIECADETGADVVAPLTCQHQPLHTFIHQAGGGFSHDIDAFFAAPKGERVLNDIQKLQGARLDETPLERVQTHACEFHCVLVRRTMLQAVNGFDEKMLATREHLDFAIAVTQQGGLMMFEPTSVVTYLFPSRLAPLEPADYPFFLVRWSPSWQRRSLEYFTEKWGLKDTGDLARNLEPQNLYHRTYDGVIKTQLRRMGWVAQAPVLSTLVRKAISLTARAAGAVLVARSDRARGANA